MRKRWGLALVLALVCVVLLGVGVSAETVAEGVCGDDLTWVLDDAGVLTISGSGNFIGFEYYTDAPWHPYANSVTTVYLPDSIVMLGQDAFRGCSNLTAINLPDKLIAIGDRTFFECHSLNEIVLPSNLKTIGNYAFAYCTSLASIALPDSVYRIGEGVFYMCTSLKSASLSHSLDAISREAFRGCHSLVSISIPSEISMIWSNAFRDCASLNSIIFPDSLTTLGEGVFQDCDNLETVVCNDGLTVISPFTFAFCNNLKNVTLPDTLTTIGSNAFTNCTVLDTIVFPQSLEHIGKNAFRRTSIASVVFPEALTYLPWNAFYASATSMVTFSNDSQIRYDFIQNTGNITTVCLTNNIHNIPQNVCALDTIGAYNVKDTDGEGYVSFDGILYTYDPYLEAYTLVRYPASKSGESYRVLEGTEAIGAYAFQNCQLKQVDLRDRITSIEEYAFCGCGNLTTLCISRLECNVDEYAFCDTNIQYVELGNINRYAKDTHFINFPSIIAYSVQDTDNMGYRAIDGVLFFFDKSSQKLELVNYPLQREGTQYIVPDGTYSIADNAFSGTTNLKDIALPSTLHAIGENAFLHCTSLKSIRFPVTMTSIGSSAFEGCTALETATLPTALSNMGANVFKNCTALQSICLPQNLEYIDNCAFQNCTRLKEISLPKTVASLGYSCFANCTALRRVYFYGNAPSINSNTFTNTHSTFTIYYIAGKSGWTSPTWNGYNTATFVPEGNPTLTLLPSSPYRITGGTLSNVPAATTVAAFVAQFDTDHAITVSTPTGAALSDTAFVGTRCVVSLTVDGAVVDTLTIVVTGDLSGDGLSDRTDLALLQQYYSGYHVTIDFPAAADLNGDGTMTRADAMVLARRLAGWNDAMTPPSGDVVIIG